MNALPPTFKFNVHRTNFKSRNILCVKVDSANFGEIENSKIEELPAAREQGYIVEAGTRTDPGSDLTGPFFQFLDPGVKPNVHQIRIRPNLDLDPNPCF